MSKKYFHRIFLIGADYEVDNLFKDIELSNYQPNLSYVYRLKTTKDNKNLVVTTGFSKTNASAAAQFIIDHFDSDNFINLGLVGSLTPKLNIGDVVSVKECRFYDVDFTAFKYKLGQIPQTKIFIYPLKVQSGFKITQVKLISGDRFLTDKSLIPSKILNYRPHCVEVELASIAHVFYINGRLSKLSSIRTVSDNADDHAAIDFYLTPNKMFYSTNKLIRDLLKSC